MKKTTKAITLDNDLAVWVSLNVKNASAEVNNYFRARMEESLTEEKKELALLEQELEEVKKISIENLQRQTILLNKIEDLKKTNKEEELKEDEENLKLGVARKKAGVSRFYAF